jgi:hypothetical protein
MRQFWIESSPGLLLAIVVVTASYWADRLSSRGQIAVRAPYKLLVAGGLWIWLGGTFLVDGWRHHAVGARDAWVWLGLIVALLVGGAAIVFMFLRWRITAEADVLKVRRSFAASVVVPWRAIYGTEVSYGSIKFDARPIARPSIDLDCRGLLGFLDAVEAHGVAISAESREKVSARSAPVWTTVFGVAGVLVGEIIVRLRRNGQR